MLDNDMNVNFMLIFNEFTLQNIDSALIMVKVCDKFQHVLKGGIIFGYRCTVADI